MPNNKKHHYIPKFLLRNFSNSFARVAIDEVNAIDMLQINSGKIVFGASISGQCQKNYLYGKTGTIEQQLGRAESEAAKIIRTLITSSKMKDFHLTIEHQKLIVFIAAQIGRTLVAKEHHDDLFDSNMKYHLQPKLTAAGYSDNVSDLFKIGTDDGMLQSLLWKCACYPFLFDLSAFLLVNNTSTGFVISDNPCITYNLFYEGETRFSTTGFNNGGLLIFLPISPKHSIVLVDEYYYRIKNRVHNTVEISSTSDIDELNKLQILSSQHSLYFSSDTISTEALLHQVNNLSTKKHQRQAITRTVKKHIEQGVYVGDFYISYLTDLNADLNLSFLKQSNFVSTRKNRIKRHPPESRSHILDIAYRKFLDTYRDGGKQPGDFVFYIQQELGITMDALKTESDIRIWRAYLGDGIKIS